MPAIEDRAAAFVRAYDAEGVHRTAQVGDEENADFLAGEAKALGADLAVFPELWNIGATLSPLDPEGRQR